MTVWGRRTSAVAAACCT